MYLIHLVSGTISRNRFEIIVRQLRHGPRFRKPYQTIPFQILREVAWQAAMIRKVVPVACQFTFSKSGFWRKLLETSWYPVSGSPWGSKCLSPFLFLQFSSAVMLRALHLRLGGLDDYVWWCRYWKRRHWKRRCLLKVMDRNRCSHVCFFLNVLVSRSHCKNRWLLQVRIEAWVFTDRGLLSHPKYMIPAWTLKQQYVLKLRSLHG